VRRSPKSFYPVGKLSELSLLSCPHAAKSICLASEPCDVLGEAMV
jgi:hypothetical protein